LEELEESSSGSFSQLAGILKLAPLAVKETASVSEDIKMKVRANTLLLTALFIMASLSIQAQEQGSSQGSAQGGGGPQGASIMPASNLDTQGIRRYVLGPGDTLDVRVFGQPDLNWQGEVEADGNITSLPFIDTPIRAQCRTDKDIQKDVIAAYSKFLRSPQISVRVTGRNSRNPATIFGGVAAPARIQMMRKVRLNEMITQSGGVTERANGDIQILHTEPVMCLEPGEVDEPLTTPDGLLAANTLKVYKLSDLIAGKTEANPIIRPGDIVTVMESKPVYITGSVTSPQPVLLREGYTLGHVIAMVGGPTTGAKASDVRIYRQKPGSIDQEVIHVDLEAIKKQKKEDVLLQAYDIIEVPKTSDWNFKSLITGLGRSMIGGVSSLPTSALQYRVIY
jgi:protein involved in polysaccharide export with SLBB domain